MNKSINPYSFNKRVVSELKMFIEIIDELYNQFDKLKWSTHPQEEIGFYIRDKNLKYEIFFGIWFDLWEHYEIPLSIVFNYYGKAPIEWHNNLKNQINSLNKEGIKIEYFEDLTCILLDYPFFKFSDPNYINEIANFYQEIGNMAFNLSSQ